MNISLLQRKETLNAVQTNELDNSNPTSETVLDVIMEKGSGRLAIQAFKTNM